MFQNATGGNQEVQKPFKILEKSKPVLTIYFRQKDVAISKYCMSSLSDVVNVYLRNMLSIKEGRQHARQELMLQLSKGEEINANIDINAVKLAKEIRSAEKKYHVNSKRTLDKLFLLLELFE